MSPWLSAVLWGGLGLVIVLVVLVGVRRLARSTEDEERR